MQHVWKEKEKTTQISRIRNLGICTDPDPGPSPYINKQKKLMKNLDFYCFVTSLWLFLSLKNDVDVPSKRNKHREKKLIFVGVLKVIDEKSRILSRIR